MLLCVLLLAAAGQAGDASVVDDRRVTVFTAPLSALLWPLATSPTEAYVPVGVIFPVGRMEWVVDAAFVYGTPGTSHLDIYPASVGFWFAVGPTFRQKIGKLQRGAFITPKLTVSYFAHRYAPRRETDCSGSTGCQLTDTWVERSISPSGSVMLGADFGYQWNFGKHFYVAFALGTSVGIGSQQPFGPLFAALTRGIGSTGGDHGLGGGVPLALAIGLNADLLRIGFTF